MPKTYLVMKEIFLPYLLETVTNIQLIWKFPVQVNFEYLQACIFLIHLNIKYTFLPFHLETFANLPVNLEISSLDLKPFQHIKRILQSTWKCHHATGVFGSLLYCTKCTVHLSLIVSRVIPIYTLFLRTSKFVWGSIIQSFWRLKYFLMSFI